MVKTAKTVLLALMVVMALEWTGLTAHRELMVPMVRRVKMALTVLWVLKVLRLRFHLQPLQLSLAFCFAYEGGEINK